MKDKKDQIPQPIEITQHFRLEALGHAVRHRLKDETSDNVVEAAKKYFIFLQGD